MSRISFNLFSGLNLHKGSNYMPIHGVLKVELLQLKELADFIYCVF